MRHQRGEVEDRGCCIGRRLEEAVRTRRHTRQRVAGTHHHCIDRMDYHHTGEAVPDRTVLHWVGALVDHTVHFVVVAVEVLGSPHWREVEAKWVACTLHCWPDSLVAEVARYGHHHGS